MVIQNFFMLKFMFFTDKQCSHSLMDIFLTNSIYPKY